MIFIEIWSCHFHNYIIIKAMDEIISFFTAFINREVQNISVGSVGSHPNFNSIFIWLCWHLLTEFQPTFESNHCLVDWNILLRIINSLDILEYIRKNQTAFVESIIIRFSLLGFARGVAEMKILADFFKPTLCHHCLNATIFQKYFFWPVVSNSW